MTTNKDILKEVKKGNAQTKERLDTLNGQVAKNTKFRWFVTAIVSGIVVGVPLWSALIDSVNAGQ